MLVAVFNTVEIPYVVKLGPVEYQFYPQTEVPDEMAKKIIANQPDIFFAVGEKVIDISEYKVKDVFQGKTIQEIFNGLPEKERVDIYAYVKKKAQEAQKKELKKKAQEIVASKEVKPDALQAALGIENVPEEVISEATGESKKPEIKKVREK